jgi:SAM-dependent methyltransferase
MSKPAPKKAASAKPQATFGVKLHAWWQGYDADEYIKRLPSNAPVAAEAPKDVPKSKPSLDDSLAFDPWSAERVDVAQLIWGKSFCGPGGPDYIISMSKLLALTPEMSIADLGAGLGGPARVLAEHFGVWVTGFETSNYLVTAGNEMSYMSGMARKAPIRQLDLTAAEPFERRYDRIYGHGFLTKLHALNDMTSKLSAALKSDGLALFTDYFVRDKKCLTDPDVIEWLAVEPHTLHLHVADAVQKQFDANKLLVRVNESITDSYSKLVTAGWKEADQVVAALAQDAEASHLLPVLLREAELWSRRLKIFASGKIEVRRILAAKVG